MTAFCQPRLPGGWCLPSGFSEVPRYLASPTCWRPMRCHSESQFRAQVWYKLRIANALARSGSGAYCLAINMKGQNMTQDSSSDSYQSLREKWVHEDNLFNHRITWLLVSQSLLFAAYATCLTSSSSTYAGKIKMLIVVILPAIGLVLTVGIGAAVFAAFFAQKSLERKSPDRDLYVPGCHNLVGYSPVFLFPIVFMILISPQPQPAHAMSQ